MRTLAVLSVLVAVALAREIAFSEVLKKLQMPSQWESATVKDQAKLAHNLLMYVPEEQCTIIYHVPEGQKGHLTWVDSHNDDCRIDEPTHYTYHQRSGTLVVFYDENANEETIPPTGTEGGHGEIDVTDVSVRAWTGHQWPGEKLKASVSKGCQICRHGYNHEVARVVDDACDLATGSTSPRCVCEKTGEVIHFDTVDQKHECNKNYIRNHIPTYDIDYYCTCREGCHQQGGRRREHRCNVPLHTRELPHNQRTTVSSSVYSDLSSEDWTNESSSSSSSESESSSSSSSSSSESSSSDSSSSWTWTQ